MDLEYGSKHILEKYQISCNHNNNVLQRDQLFEYHLQKREYMLQLSSAIAMVFVRVKNISGSSSTMLIIREEFAQLSIVQFVLNYAKPTNELRNFQMFHQIDTNGRCL